ncbi:hypothetical protein MKX07_000933 [Trichoderma sp. CBMAI-0711]|nr:hypothetical protein MKX07_000933 [Trichoderma sp. CBMAI-0711]
MAFTGQPPHMHQSNGLGKSPYSRSRDCKINSTDEVDKLNLVAAAWPANIFILRCPEPAVANKHKQSTAVGAANLLRSAPSFDLDDVL